MKKILLCLIFFLFSLQLIEAQIWKYVSSGNDFDGKYKTSSVTGVASRYPYNKPTLVINYFDKDESLNFYISDAGYYSESSGVKVLWVFSNEKEVIYEASAREISSNGKIIFFYEFKSSKSDEYISIYEFINKLKNASSVSVRVSDKYDTNDINFSLKGSTNAINYVISNTEINLKVNKTIEERNIQRELQRVKDSTLNAARTILSKLKKISTNPSLSLNKINRDDLVGQKIKFLFKKGASSYEGFGKNKNAYPYLDYDTFKGRIATIVNLQKELNYSDTYTYTLELEDNKEIVYLKIYSFDEFSNEIGFVSLLENARAKYLGKTFYSNHFPREDKIEALQECKIINITFAEDDVEYAQLHGAFNVYYETKGYYTRLGTVLQGVFFEEAKLKMLNVLFSDTYSPTEGYKGEYDKLKVFENIFYYIED